jgi:hypothetical protein
LHQVVARTFLLGLAALLHGTSASAQGTPDSAKIAAVNTVIDYRVIWMEDSTPFDACSVYEGMGKPANFSSVLARPARRVVALDSEPCGGAPGAAVRRPSRVVRVDSVALGDTLGTVRVTVNKGEKRIIETYSLRRFPNRSGWGVRAVTLTGALRVYASPLPPVTAPAPQRN